jgi:hypothetical protein
MLNLLIPVKGAAASTPVRGLRFSSEGEVQRQFAKSFAREGTILVGSGSKGCLCGFGDWDAFYEIVRDLMHRHRVEWASAIHFWSGVVYELTERSFDPYDTEECTELLYGEIAVMRAAHPEQRRHRRVVRALARRVGGAVVLRMKGGREIQGTLTQFDAEAEVGSLGGATFIAAQVFEVVEAP